MVTNWASILDNWAVFSVHRGGCSAALGNA